MLSITLKVYTKSEIAVQKKENLIFIVFFSHEYNSKVPPVLTNKKEYYAGEAYNCVSPARLITCL